MAEKNQTPPRKIISQEFNPRFLAEICNINEGDIIKAERFDELVLEVYRGDKSPRGFQTVGVPNFETSYVLVSRYLNVNEMGPKERVMGSVTPLFLHPQNIKRTPESSQAYVQINEEKVGDTKGSMYSFYINQLMQAGIRVP